MWTNALTMCLDSSDGQISHAKSQIPKRTVLNLSCQIPILNLRKFINLKSLTPKCQISIKSHFH